MILGLLLLFAAQIDGPTIGRSPIQAVDVDGERLFTVQVKNEPLHRVLDRLMVEWNGRSVLDNGHLDRSTLISMQLVERPIAQVLEYLLGAVGLAFEVQGGDLFLLPEAAVAHTPQEALLYAENQWLAALRRFPTAPEAPGAYMSLAELQEQRGAITGAREHYETVVDRFPDAAEVPEALMRTGRVYKRERHFDEAARVFGELAGRGDASAYVPNAYLQLAICRTELSNPQEALHILDLLDTDFVVADPSARAERLIARGDALNGLGRWMDALRALDRAEPLLDELTARGSHRIRAIAFAGIGYKAEASAAWVRFAAEGNAGEKLFAYVEAAELALEAEDELAVLVIERQAAIDGAASPELNAIARRAERRLGLASSPALEGKRVPDKLMRIGELLDQTKTNEARQPLEQLYRGRGALPSEESAEVVRLYARLIRADEGLSPALAILREERPLFAGSDSLRTLDCEAARLLEADAQWERAADAYEGRY